jgi:hypothetical protein
MRSETYQNEWHLTRQQPVKWVMEAIADMGEENNPNMFGINITKRRVA